MAKPEWGTKRKCLDCGSVFYDMKKDPVVCPKCGHSYKLSELLEKQQQATVTRRKAKVLDLLDENSEIPEDIMLDDTFEDEDMDTDDDTLLDEEDGEESDTLSDVIPVKKNKHAE